MVETPGSTQRLVAAVVASVSVWLSFALPDARGFYLAVATFCALCCLTPGKGSL